LRQRGRPCPPAETARHRYPLPGRRSPGCRPRPCGPRPGPSGAGDAAALAAQSRPMTSASLAPAEPRAGIRQARPAGRLPATSTAPAPAGRTAPAGRPLATQPGAQRQAEPSQATPIRSPRIRCAEADPSRQTGRSQQAPDLGSAAPAIANRCGAHRWSGARSLRAHGDRRAILPAVCCQSGLRGSWDRCQRRQRTASLGCPQTRCQSKRAAPRTHSGPESKVPGMKSIRLAPTPAAQPEPDSQAPRADGAAVGQHRVRRRLAHRQRHPDDATQQHRRDCGTRMCRPRCATRQWRQHDATAGCGPSDSKAPPSTPRSQRGAGMTPAPGLLRPGT
jgi:hypothetical protein